MTYYRGGDQLSGAAEEGVRLTRNAIAYDFAMRGDGNALAFLQYRTGEYGTKTLPRADYHPDGGPVSGWATSTARLDAASKYNAVLRYRLPSVSPATPITEPAPMPAPSIPLPEIPPSYLPQPTNGRPPQGLPEVKILGTPDKPAMTGVWMLGLIAAGALLLGQKRRAKP